MAQQPVSYHVDVDFETFKQMYLAQNRAYMRKTGIGAAVVGVLLFAFSLMGFVDTQTVEGLGMLALSIVIAAFGIAMAVRPFTFWQSRKQEVYSYFASHGAQVSNGDSLESLRCSYDVRLEELGFVEVLADGSSARLPWFTLTGVSEGCAFGVVLTCDDGKNSSMLYNMLGVNAYLREGLEGEPLLVPAAVVSGNPGLVQQVADLVSQSRETYGRKGTKADDAARDRLAAWLQG